MPLHAQDLGPLDLCSRKPGAFTEASELTGRLPASHAAVAFSSARTHVQMEQAVATRHITGETMGTLVDSRHLTKEQMFDTLRHHSQRNNTELREVARLIREHGALP
ncbi:ANTAR domain-containing protein [Streptomyces adustus]|uniref:ANTAR domain-containing protein n=1 Tax=Streptomyces adustus TaxID=1609272 RepID=UPI0035DC5EB4